MANQNVHLQRRVVILAKLETGYGVDPTPTPALNGILCNNTPEIEPTGEKIERDVIRQTFTGIGHIIGAKQVKVTLKVEARGGVLGATLAPPDWDPLMQACCMQRTTVQRLKRAGMTGSFVTGETVTGGVSLSTATLYHQDDDTLVVTGSTGIPFQAGETLTGGTSMATAVLSAANKGLEYKPLTAAPDGQPACAIHFYKDRILHTVLGGRGTWSLDASVGKIPIFTFVLTGLWVDPADAPSLPAPVLSGLTPPVTMGIGAKIGAYVPTATALKLDIANKVVARQDVNAVEGIVEQMITGRTPTGSIDPEVDLLSVFNPWQAWKGAVPAAIGATIGTQAGNRLRLRVDQGLFDALKYQDRNGIDAYALPFAPVDQVGAGDNEIRLTVF